MNMNILGGVMKNKVLVLGLFIVMVVIGLAVLGSVKKATTDGTQQGTVSKNNSGDMDEYLREHYVDYFSDIFSRAKDKRQVLFFYASWCDTCRPTDENLKVNVKKIPEDVIVIRVDYNAPETDEEEKALANKYGIVYQHTFVQIDSNGKEVTRWNGGKIDELLENIQ